MTHPRKTEREKLQEFSNYLHYRNIVPASIKKTEEFFEAQISKESSVPVDRHLYFSSVSEDRVLLKISDLQNVAIVGDFAFAASLPGDTSEEHLPD